MSLNPFSANPTKWSNKPKQFVGNLPTNCLNVFEHFVKLALKGLNLPKTLQLIFFFENLEGLVTSLYLFVSL